jgi:hypothetical protein
VDHTFQPTINILYFCTVTCLNTFWAVLQSGSSEDWVHEDVDWIPLPQCMVWWRVLWTFFLTFKFYKSKEFLDQLSNCWPLKEGCYGVILKEHLRVSYYMLACVHKWQVITVTFFPCRTWRMVNWKKEKQHWGWRLHWKRANRTL